MPKFIQSLDNQVYTELEKLAKERGITVQTLIRAVIVPEWAAVTGADVNGPKSPVRETSATHTLATHRPDFPPTGGRELPQSRNLAPSNVYLLHHFKPSRFQTVKQEEQTEKADIIVNGRKRRHH